MAKIHPLDLNIRPAGGPKTRIYRFSQWIVRKVGDFYWSLKAFHLENVPETGPCLILSNHCSMIDPPIVGTYITREMHSLGRDNLFRIPLVGAYIRRINSHPIRREGIDREAIKTAARILD
ncbi:1-acyl-sn-glycerol-3-phosphate acyltransferase, partial [Candidatus Sumerlaeota bacterium]|nr:1-acyl-sn-glycerol-3-phosphate acyltransferase [Candidatus Sumerlaeota bacterium]